MIHFRSKHIIKIARVIAVAAHAVSRPADLAGNVSKMRKKPLPFEMYYAGLNQIALKKRHQIV
jgi:hypothetical protein